MPYKRGKVAEGAPSFVLLAALALLRCDAAAMPWSGKDLGGNGLNSAPSFVRYGPNGIYSTSVGLFYRGLDNHLWVRWSNHGQPWGEPQDLGGVLTSAPTAVATGPHVIDVFFRGPNNHLWTISMGINRNWSPATDLGGVDLTSSPSAVTGAQHVIDVFYRGSNGHLWTSWWDGRSWWSPATDLGGGQLMCSPSAVSRFKNRIDVFYCGPNRHLWTSWWDGGQWWSAAEEVGSDALTSDPSASGSARSLDVYYRGSNFRLWSISYKGYIVGPPPDGRSGIWWSDATQVTNDEFTLDFGASDQGVFFRGSNNHLWVLQHLP